jgi:F-type H+-transporting ATPase subunit b
MMSTKRFSMTLALLVMAAVCVLTPALSFAAEGAKVKAPLIPPLTGPEAGQTYMQAIWVIIIFVILLAVLYPTAWKNVLAGLKAREERIRGDIASAEVARAKAEATLKDYNARLADAEKQVREMIAKAVTDAEAAAANIRTRSQSEAEEIKEKAMKEIEGAKTTALREVYDQTAMLATNVAEKILRRNLNADDQRDLVSRSLDQLQNVNKN